MFHGKVRIWDVGGSLPYKNYELVGVYVNVSRYSCRWVGSWGPGNDKQQVQVLIERSAESVTP